MSKTLGGNAGPVTCFRGAGAMYKNSEQPPDFAPKFGRLVVKLVAGCAAVIVNLARPAKTCANTETVL